MIDEAKIQRINELAKKAKSAQGLTEEDLKEQVLLRREYVEAVKQNLQGQLEHTYIVDKDGRKHPLRKKQGGPKQ